EEFFHWENVFLARGMATFTLEGPGQGECGYQLPIRPDYEVAVSAALDVLTQRNDLDASRIGVAGVSLGGYYAVRACLDPRVKAAVENCGPFTFAEDWNSVPALTRAAFQYHSGARDEAEAQQLTRMMTLESVAHKVKQPLLILTANRIASCRGSTRSKSLTLSARMPNSRCSTMAITSAITSRTSIVRSRRTGF
ncbi:MAG: prolyl oligopeptidase family serine peptidase, partial [Chloroflexota bacterium]